VMIVDMVRNDMGRIAKPGTVHVPKSFEIEKYPTVMQMTSTVSSSTSASFSDIVRALFPCASITGAPKVRTMQIIKELEQSARGIYTGAIGYMGPHRKAEFNVAIRTVMIDKKEKHAEYGVGGGIVWDSQAEKEYYECRVKTAVLIADRPDFELLETILWEKGKGYFLLDKHLNRLKQSAGYFEYPLDLETIQNRLAVIMEDWSETMYKVRIKINEQGKISIESQPLDELATVQALKIKLADKPVKTKDPFLYHKTTNRKVYDNARKTRKEYDDVLLWNEKNEITESTIANVVIEKNGKKITPPVNCGLLAGTFREWLLERGEIEEGIVTVEDFYNADKVFLINSVRHWISVKETARKAEE
jgi:para-aminobenzoate synthetase/4-amino-4-deoxychorismate lyase